MRYFIVLNQEVAVVRSPSWVLPINGFDPVDQLERYVRWFREGHLSSTGCCFDIGNTSRDALTRFEKTRQPFCGSTDPRAAGNGSLMRLAPVPLMFAENPEQAIEKAGESSRTTHGAAACVDACRYFGGLIVGALRGTAKADLLSDGYCPVPGYWEKHPLVPEVTAVAAGSFKKKDPPEIRGTGYVVDSLEAALWAFHRTENFQDGLLKVVNLGDDADTTGAIYGQIAGALYGEKAIPHGWRSKLAHRKLIESLADRLYRFATKQPSEPSV